MQSFAFSPPVKVTRGSMRFILLPAPGASKAASVGLGTSQIELSGVAAAEFGHSVAWTISRTPLITDEPQAPAQTRMILHLWSFPRSTEPLVHSVTVPEANFVPVASTEVPDTRDLLIVGSSGTVVKVPIPPIGRVQGTPADIAPAVYPMSSRGITAPVAAAACDGMVYVASVGSSVIVALGLDSNGSFLESRIALDSSVDRSWKWVPTVVSLGGLFRRRGKDSMHVTASKTPNKGGSGILRLFCVCGHCVAEMPSEVALFSLTGNGNDDVQWRWPKELPGSNPIERVIDATVTASEVWILLRVQGSPTATLVTLLRTNATVTCTVDVPFNDGQATGIVAAARRSTISNPSWAATSMSARIHAIDDTNAVIVTRQDLHRCCLASTVRVPQSFITEQNPPGVVTLASKRLDDTSICLLTNCGVAVARRPPPDATSLDTSVGLSPSVGSSYRMSASRVLERTPQPAQPTDSALVRSPRQHSIDLPDEDPSSISAGRPSKAAAVSVRFYFNEVVGAEAHGGIDNAWLRASDEIANKLVVNQSTWAQADLTVEDPDGMAFITGELKHRLAHHEALLSHLVQTARWQQLKPPTQAALLSRTEMLAMYVALRMQHNDACPKEDHLRSNIFREAVISTAATIRRDTEASQLASCSELTFCSVDHAVRFLAGVNDSLRTNLTDTGVPVVSTLLVAASCSEIWIAALESIEKQRQQYRSLLLSSSSASVRLALWTTNQDSNTATISSMENVLSSFILLAAESLTLVVDAAEANPDSEISGRSNAAHTVVSALDRGLRFVFANTLRRPEEKESLLRRTAFSGRFVFSGRIGFPHGSPRPLALPRLDICPRLLDLAEGVAAEFCIHHVLFDIAAADNISDDVAAAAQRPGDIPQWSKVEKFAAEVPGFYRHFLRTLVYQFREVELFAARKVIPRLLDGDVEVEWNSFMRKEAPHALWVGHTSVPEALIVSSVVLPPTGLALGRTLLEHRSRSLSLASLEWVASGRPDAIARGLETEKLIVSALKTHLPHLADASPQPAAEDTVRALLEANSVEAFQDAARIADRVIDAVSREQLLIAVIVRLFYCDEALFTKISKDDSLGDRARLQGLADTTTGATVSCSKHLQMLALNVDRVAAATSQTYASALRRWVMSYFAAP